MKMMAVKKFRSAKEGGEGRGESELSLREALTMCTAVDQNASLVLT